MSKSAKTKAKKKESKVEKSPEEAERPSGRPPMAAVLARHDGSMVERAGRGFSVGELAGAALPLRLARKWNLKVDEMRRSTLEGNVKSLKAWWTPPARKAKPAEESKPAPKKGRAKKPA